MQTKLTDSQKGTKFYKLGHKWGMSDAAGGCMFSRYVLQHGDPCKVDYDGHATKLAVHQGAEILIALGYVNGCCGKD